MYELTSICNMYPAIDLLFLFLTKAGASMAPLLQAQV